jgi:hypothetical protein
MESRWSTPRAVGDLLMGRAALSGEERRAPAGPKVEGGRSWPVRR